MVEALIGPGNNARRVGLQSNLKDISLDQFRDLYDVLLTYFVVVFCRSDSEGRRILKSIDVNADLGPNRCMLEPLLKKVVSNKGLSEAFMISLGLIGDVDMAQLGGQAWEEVVSILGCGDSLAGGQLAFFSIVAGNAYIEAGKDV